jgi:carboxymethylenebutenolidase
MKKVTIRTEDGICPAYEFQPDGNGPWPGVLFYMDGIGIRPAMFQMGERLAKAGYFVLMPDLFYRVGPYEPMDAKKVFSDPEQRKVLMSKFIGALTPALAMKDSIAYLAHLAASPSARQPKVGTTGYCMGGRMSITAAGTFGERIAASAAFHPGGLVTDAPDSPHLLAPKIKAVVRVAGASEDPNFTDEQKAKLEKALTDAKVEHTVETWPAKHGWVPSDTPVHDPVQAERHWKVLVELFDRALK